MASAPFVVREVLGGFDLGGRRSRFMLADRPAFDALVLLFFPAGCVGTPVVQALACDAEPTPVGPIAGVRQLPCARAELRRKDNEVVLNARYAGRALGCEGERIALKGRIDCAPEMYCVVGDDDIDVVER